jgi:hypothetical protein
MGIRMMKRVLHWFLFGACVFFAWPIWQHFCNPSGEQIALASMPWVILLVVAAKGAWTTFFTGWQEDVKISRWKRAGWGR